MPYTSHPFAHRTKADGTIDAICKRCFMTVGTAEGAEALKVLEASHVCDPWRLEVINAIAPR
jgi:hypothetical protein